MGDGFMTTANPADQFGELRRRVMRYAEDYGRSFEGLPCSLYYNININEDREAAFQESKTYLDQYYSVDYKREVVENWVALGFRSNASSSCKPSWMPGRLTFCSVFRPGISEGNSSVW